MLKLKLPDFSGMKIPAAALVIGLLLGLGTGFFMVKNERGISQEKIREASRKIAFLQKKLTDEKNETILGIEQKCQTEIDRLQKDKAAADGQLSGAKKQVRALEEKCRQADAVSAKLKSDLQGAQKNLAASVKQGGEWESDLKKTKAEKQALQSELRKTAQVLGRCEANNARLCIIAEELVNSYRGKGPMKAILEREPLTQIKKVELEKMVQTYREEIDQQKLKKKLKGEN